jgi:hypothetical protein
MMMDAIDDDTVLDLRLVMLLRETAKAGFAVNNFLGSISIECLVPASRWTGGFDERGTSLGPGNGPGRK